MNLQEAVSCRKSPCCDVTPIRVELPQAKSLSASAQAAGMYISVVASDDQACTTGSANRARIWDSTLLLLQQQHPNINTPSSIIIHMMESDSSDLQQDDQRDYRDSMLLSSALHNTRK